ncbi:mediator of RNA polymerase II transcription subunit 23-like isoform X2 [Paramacrobiotus metropolitanus]|uniref:mediator of RNA polymerase II transcription subunit 23-like isoform X2 n=1 Tax=Paramacrobiotus metropolitanus TaxID=2943436 RepID=UPI00244606B0|nr:mediator of RNA polymerase II transcription subunit 23-like isoform X2 [Paramacrobiotus metropolitanus]
MAASDPLTEQAVASMIKILDRYESFVTLFSHTVKNPVNDPLNELIDRLPGLFLPTSLETQKTILDLLVQYILNPLNNKKICDALYNGILHTLQSASVSHQNTAGKLFLLAVLNSQFELKQPELCRLVVPVLKSLDMKAVGEILRAAVEKSQRLRAKRKLGAETDAYGYLGGFLQIILCSSTCPSVILLPEIVNTLSTKNWRSSGLIMPSASFFENFEKTVELVKIRERQFSFPVVGYSLYHSPLWGMDRTTLQFTMPAIQEFVSDKFNPPQTELVQYLLEQANSRPMCQSILGISKQNTMLSLGLEGQIVAVMVRHLQCFDEQLLYTNWMHILNHVLSAVSCNYIRFSSVMHNLEVALDSIKLDDLSTGRFYCIWLFYQWVAAQHNLPVSVKDVAGSLRLILKMFPEEEYLHVPELSSKYAIIHLSPGYLWAYVSRRASYEKFPLPCGTPRCLLGQLEFIRTCIDRAVLPSGLGFLDITLEHIAVVNCFVPMSPTKIPEANRMDHCDRMIASLTENLVDNSTSSSFVERPETMAAPGGSVVLRATKPLSLELLDGLSGHARLLLANSLAPSFTRIISDYASKPEKVFLSSGFLETNARLCVYEENEQSVLGWMIRKLPEIAISNRAWFVLVGQLELLSFRAPYIPFNWKPILVVMVMNIVQRFVTMTNTHSHPHAVLYVEQLAIRIIQSLNIYDMHYIRNYLGSANVITAQQEVEELLRLSLLTSFRLAQISGLDATTMQFLTKYVAESQQVVAHLWGNPGTTNGNTFLWNVLPEPVQNLYKDVKITREKPQSRRMVDEMIIRLRAAANDNDVRTILMGTHGSYVLHMYCIIWKQLMENMDQNMPFRSPALIAAVLDKSGYKGQLHMLRIFIDYIIMELTAIPPPSPERISRQLDCLRLMIWKLGIIPFERFLFMLIMRHFDMANELQMALVIVVQLCKSTDFQSRLMETVNLIPPDYLNHEQTFFEKVVAYHQLFPEVYYFNGTYDYTQPGVPAINHEPLPVYFSNVILRCVPVFNIVIHRFLEFPKNSSQLQHFESFLDNIGKIFRYHDHPVNFIWQTLHFYDHHLKDVYNVRRKLIRTILGAKAEYHMPNFYLTRYCEAYLTAPQPDAFVFSAEYYDFLVTRLTLCLYSHNLEIPYHGVEWRFHEHPSPAAHALYTSCIELMCIPGPSEAITENLLNVVRRRFPAAENGSKEYAMQTYDQFLQCLNCVALMISALPERLFVGLLGFLRTLLEDTDLVTAGNVLMDMFDLKKSYFDMKKPMHGLFLQIFHATILHGGSGHLLKSLEFFHTVIVPFLGAECQLIYVMNLFVPLLPKIGNDPVRLGKWLSAILILIQRVGSRQNIVFQHAATLRDVLYYVMENYGKSLDLRRDQVTELLSTVQPEYGKYLVFLQQFVKPEGDNST